MRYSYAVDSAVGTLRRGRYIAPAVDNVSYAVDSKILYRPQEVPANPHFILLAVDAVDTYTGSSRQEVRKYPDSFSPPILEAG